MTFDIAAKEAVQFWNNGEPLVAGRILADAMSPGMRRAWASSSLLKFAMKHSNLRISARSNTCWLSLMIRRGGAKLISRSARFGNAP